jgi:hypothetical protein
MTIKLSSQDLELKGKEVRLDGSEMGVAMAKGRDDKELVW